MAISRVDLRNEVETPAGRGSRAKGFRAANGYDIQIDGPWVYVNHPSWEEGIGIPESNVVVTFHGKSGSKSAGKQPQR